MRKNFVSVKLILFVATVLLVNLSGCDKREDIPERLMEAYFGTSDAVYPAEIVLEGNDNGVFVVIKNTKEWTLVVTYPEGDDGGWCTVKDDIELTGAGDKSIWIALQPNTGGADRKVYITIVGIKDIIPLTLIQKHYGGGTVPTILSATINRSMPIEWDATGFDISVISNTDWNISFTYSDEEDPWCSIIDVNNSGNKTISITTAANFTSDPRSAVITITAAGREFTLNISQSATVIDPLPPTPPPVVEWRLELPAIVDQQWFLEYSPAEFALEYDITKKHSKWVAWRLHEGDFGDSGRTDAWRQDDRIPAQYRAVAGDFPSGYDRGHMCPSGERTKSKDINRQTFYYSNMSPQRASLNQGVWNQLELFERDWAQNRGDTLYICSGGAITNNQPIIDYSNGLAIPKYNFKVILRKRGADTYHAIGFWFENKDYPSRTKAYFLENLDTFIKSVDEIEALTGLDFFHILAADIQDRVEAQKNRADWTGF